MGKLLGWFFGIIIVIVLLPVIALVLMDVVKIIFASIPWQLWVAIAVVGLLILAGIVRAFLPRRHRHDHYHH